MTAAEWLTCDDAALMLSACRGNMSARKLRLFAVAAGRLLWDRMNADQRDAVEVGERLADGSAEEGDRLRCANALYAVFGHGAPTDTAAHLAATAAVGCWRVGTDMAGLPTWVGARQATAAQQPALLRDVFGNPFHPAAFSPAWQTDATSALARQMYESRDFSAMPALADALQDAGCASADMLDHCRGSGPHVRGCWVVDLVLGRE